MKTQATTLRKSLWGRCEDKAQSLGLTLEQLIIESEGRIMYVVAGNPMTPGDAAIFLGVF